MNAILLQVKTIIREQLKEHLGHVASEQLEKAGAIFYMNGNNGTEFDWHVNGRLPYFMVFYDDADNLGAVKLGVYQNGDTELFLYSDRGHQLAKELKFKIKADSQALLKLAIVLKQVADQEKKWDADIEDFQTDKPVTQDMIVDFERNIDFYKETIARRQIMNQIAVVSKKVLEEGWKVGIMNRSQPRNESDSGWYFGAGNESQDFMDKAENFKLAYIGYVSQELDPDILAHITKPVGSDLIRVSSTGFEIDDRKRAIYCERRG